MADFGQNTGQKGLRSQKRAQKLEGRLRKIIENTGDTNKELAGTMDAIAAATSKFLASFGSAVVRLNRDSRRRLTTMDPTQANKLKERAIAEVIAITRAELSDAIAKYGRGRVDANQLRESLQQTLRRQALSSAIIGVGGVGNLTENVITAVRRSLSDSFRLLDGFISDIQGRSVENRDLSRLAQYANAAHTLSQTAARQFLFDTLSNAEDLEERRVLGGAEHCDDCIALAALGWVDAGELPPIGQETVCGNSCRCTFEIRPKSDSNTYATTFDADASLIK